MYYFGYFSIFVLVPCFGVNVDGQKSEEIVVEAYHGKYRGKTFKMENKPMAGFVGISYARAPMSRHRWQKTVPLRRFGGIMDATKARPVCPQKLDNIAGNYTGKENCLYLDIMVGGGISKKAKKPVLVYLNNENSFQNGISHTGAMIARREKLVVVVVYSRLAALGYLNDGIGTGTMGLWDNMEAMRWINKNIASFSGDPDRVTVMGSESGASIATLLAISPLSDGLFNQMILLSPLSLEVSSLHQKDTPKVIRSLAGCKDDQMVSCNVAVLHPKYIVEETAHLNNVIDMEAVLADKELYPEFNFDRIKEFNLLTGSTSAEMLQMSQRIMANYSETANGTSTQQAMKQLISMICKTGFTDPSARCLCSKTMEAQFEVTDDEEQDYTLADFQKVFGGYMRAGYLKTLQAHSQSNNESNTYAFYMDVKEDPEVVGVPDEDNFGSDSDIIVKLALGYPFLSFGGKFEMINKEFYKNDLFSGIDAKKMFGGKLDLRPQSYDIMRYFANFVRTGDPCEDLRTDIKWPDYKDSGSMLSLVEGEIKLIDELPEAKVYDFFNKVYYDSKRCHG